MMNILKQSFRIGSAMFVLGTLITIALPVAADHPITVDLEVEPFMIGETEMTEEDRRAMDDTLIDFVAAVNARDGDLLTTVFIDETTALPHAEFIESFQEITFYVDDVEVTSTGEDYLNGIISMDFKYRFDGERINGSISIAGLKQSLRFEKQESGAWLITEGELAESTSLGGGFGLIIILAVIVAAFNLWMLIDVATRAQVHRRAGWVIFILLVSPIGALVYLFVGRRKAIQKKKGHATTHTEQA